MIALSQLPCTPETAIQVFLTWLRSAPHGHAFEYHQGFLAIDRTPSVSPLSLLEQSICDNLAIAAADAAAAGLVHLVQRRLGPGVFSYLAWRA